MEKKIIIISREDDPHTDVVLSNLIKRGNDVLRVHLSNIDSSLDLTIKISNDSELVNFKESKNSYSAETPNIKSIWWRRTGPAPYKLLKDYEKPYARRETKTILSGVWDIIECNWVSHPRSIDAADNKPEQLTRAKRFGFKIPHTIISNNKQNIIAFADENAGHEYLVKSATAPVIYPNTNTVSIAKTTIINNDIIDLMDEYETVPIMLQRVIKKRYELRVTVIGSDIYFAKINSQESDEGKLDWRLAGEKIKFEPYEPDPILKEKCLSFVHSYGLNYGAMDFIVTPDGEVVFLEINPIGQFIFVEMKIPEFKMIDSLCKILELESIFK